MKPIRIGPADIPPTRGTEPWQARAHCATEHGIDIMDMAHDSERWWTIAKAVCNSCPVLAECRRDNAHEEHGVWGGLDPVQRAVARKGAA